MRPPADRRMRRSERHDGSCSRILAAGMSVGDQPATVGRDLARAESSAPSVGAQLRERRFAVGMSLRELARRIDVSPSLVSQIETGKIQPSVRTLIAIVSELGLSVDHIFERAGLGSGPLAAVSAPADAVPAVVADVPGAATVCRAGQRRVIRLETEVEWQRMTTWEDPEVEFIVAVYAAGGSSSPDGTLMRHAGREFGLVLSGTLHVTVGFEDHVLGPGDSISFRSTVPHRLQNAGPEDVRAVWISHGRYSGA